MPPSKFKKAFQDLKTGDGASGEKFRKLIAEFHEELPGITEETWGTFRTKDAVTSYSHLIDSVPLADGMTILDLACGNGPLIQELLKRHSPSKVYGVDLALAEIEAAKQRIHHPTVSFIQASADRLPISDASVDVVFCHMAFMLFKPIEPVLRELARILKPGGVLAAVVGTGTGQGVYSEAMTYLKQAIQEEAPEWGQVGMGDPRAYSQEGIRSLFSASEGFCTPRVEPYFLYSEGKPTEVAKLLPKSFYSTDLLAPARRTELEKQLEQLFEKAKDTHGKVKLELNMLRFQATRA